MTAIACGGAPSGSGPAAPPQAPPTAPAEPARAASANAEGDSTAPVVAPSTAPEPTKASSVEVPATPEPTATPEELPKGSRVLQVGDSFAAALGVELAKLLKSSGVRTSVETKTPSYIGDWAFGKELRLLLSNYNPDLVLVTLGANEVEIPTPQQRAGAIQRLVKSLGGRPCVWILPPLWKKDSGVMQVIRDNAAPCQVLDSTPLVPDLPRGPDHIHPSSEGRVQWAAAVFDWLKQTREPKGPRPWSLRGGPL